MFSIETIKTTPSPKHTVSDELSKKKSPFGENMTIDELLKECEELFNEKNFKRLKWTCIKVLEQDRDNEMALAYHAYVYWDRAGWFEKDEYDHVFEIAEKLHRLYPDNYHAYNVEAMAHLDNGEFERALECCDEGLKIRYYYWLKINRVEALICLGRIEEAFEFYKSLDIPFYTFTKALVNCAKLSLLSQYDRNLSDTELLDYLFEKRKYAWNNNEIKRHFEDKLKQDSDDEIALTYMAFDYLNLQKYEPVFEITEKIHRNNPNNYHAYNIEAMAHLHMAEFERALECCDEGLKARDYYWLKISKIESLICLGRTDEAFELYSSSQIPRYYFTDALIRCEKYSLIPAYDCGLSIDEVTDRLLDKCRYIIDRRMTFENGEVSNYEMMCEKVHRVCDEIFKIDKDNEVALGYMIVFSDYLCECDEILEWCNHAIELYPKNHRFYFLKAEVLSHSDDLDGAIENYEKSLSLDFNGENGSFFLLMALDNKRRKLMKAGDYIGAINCCEKMLNFSKTNDDRLKALFHIDSIAIQHGIDYRPSKNYQKTLKSNQKIYSLLNREIGEYDDEYIDGCRQFKDYCDYEDYLRDVIICLVEMCPDGDEKSILEKFKFDAYEFNAGFINQKPAYESASEYVDDHINSNAQ